MNVSDLLQRLEKVRSTGADKWLARCPSHEDRSPSLAIKQTADSKILLHCFAGCAVADITATLGLKLSDLMPDSPDRDRTKAKAPKFNKNELFDRCVFESYILRLSIAQLLLGKPLSMEDLARVEQAESVIDDLAREVRL